MPVWPSLMVILFLLIESWCSSRPPMTSLRMHRVRHVLSDFCKVAGSCQHKSCRPNTGASVSGCGCSMGCWAPSSRAAVNRDLREKEPGIFVSAWSLFAHIFPAKWETAFFEAVKVYGASQMLVTGENADLGNFGWPSEMYVFPFVFMLARLLAANVGEGPGCHPPPM